MGRYIMHLPFLLRPFECQPGDIMEHVDDTPAADK